MLRVGGVVALLASVSVAGLLLLRIREERYAGPVAWVQESEFTFEAVEAPEPLVIGGFSVRPLPSTVPAALEAILVRIKSLEWIGLGFKTPAELRDHVVKAAPAEFSHVFLDLPLAGPVAGRTSLKVGSGEWRSSPWPFWGSIAGIAAAPGLLWLLATLPILLLRRRPGAGRA